MGLSVGTALPEGAAETDGEQDTVGEDVGSVGLTVGDGVIKLLPPLELLEPLSDLPPSLLPLFDSSFSALPPLTFSALPAQDDLPPFDAAVGMADTVGPDETLGDDDGIAEMDGDDDTLGDCVGEGVMLLPLLESPLFDFEDVLPLLGGACITEPSPSFCALDFPDLAVMLLI